MTVGKNIAILGLGKEGVATANYFSGTNKLTVLDVKRKGETDSKLLKLLKNSQHIRYFFGGSIPDEKFDLIVRSPGIRPDDPTIQKIKGPKAVVTTGTELFFQNCPGTIIGVTGTKGKGTTSTLIYQMLKTTSNNVHLGGNIGIPALDILPKLDKKSVVVLELSSFQLIDLESSPHIAVVLMTTSEHMDWHKSQDGYLEAKGNLTKFQKSNDFAVINADYPNSLRLAQTQGKPYFFSMKRKVNGMYIAQGSIYSAISKSVIADTAEVFIPGRHNLENIMAAAIVAQLTGISVKNINHVVRTFKGLAHRLQLIAAINGVAYYNDSFSTTPEAAIAAIRAFDKPKILILGGSSKHSDFAELGNAIIGDVKIKALILIGSEQETIAKAVNNAGKFKGKIITKLNSMSEIVKQASAIAQHGEIVLLSPGCASFGMFKNYQDRGDQFINCVKKLK